MGFDPQTITVTDDKDRIYTSPLTVSPALEESNIAPVAPILTAIGHALFAS